MTLDHVLLVPGKKDGENQRMGKSLKTAFFAGVSLYLMAFWFLYLNGSLLYFGEAVSYEGLLRMLLGLPFASANPSPPISLTPYSPIFLLPLVGLGKLLQISAIHKAMILARVYQSVLLGILFLSINRIRTHFFPQYSNGISFLLACVFLFSFSPTMELALRPDTLSFLFECWGVYSVFFFLKTNENHRLFLAALFFSAAIATKLNTVGCFLGALGFFVWAKDWRSCLKLGLATFLLTLLFLGAHEAFLGEAFSKNILLSIQSQLWNMSGAIEVYKKVFDLFLIPLSFYFFLILWGLHSFEDRNQSVFFRWILGVSLLLAFLGQMKWGAFHNYFLGALYLGLIPASIGLSRLSSSSKNTTLFAIGMILAFFLIRSVAIPVKNFLDNRHFFELAKLQELVQEKVPSGFLYTSDEKINLGFVGKTAIGVLTEELLWTTPKLKPLLPRIQEELAKVGGPQAYITICSASPPNQWGFSNSENWEKTQTGKYCLYTHAIPKN